MQKLLSYHYIYLIPLLLSAIFSLKSFRRGWPGPYRIFSIFLIITLMTEVSAISWKWYLYKTPYWSFSKSNLWIYNAAHILRFFLFTLFYSRMLTAPFFKRPVWYIAIPLIIFGCLEYAWLQGPHTMNSYTIILTNFSCILLSLSFFRQLLKEDKPIRLSAHPMVWISLGSFVYFSGSLPFFIFFNYLFKHNVNLAISLLYINHALNTIMYSFFLISFLCNPHSRK